MPPKLALTHSCHALIPCRYLVTPREELNQDELQFLDIARAGAKALWSMSSSQRNREAMRKYGMIPLIARLLKTIHLDVAVPTTGLLQMCASETSFQLAIQTEKMVDDLIKHLANDDKDLKVIYFVILQIGILYNDLPSYYVRKVRFKFISFSQLTYY